MSHLASTPIARPPLEDSQSARSTSTGGHIAPVLSPVQQRAFERTRDSLAAAPATILLGSAGIGKSTILAALARATGGRILPTRALLEASPTPGHPSIEEALHRLLSDALDHAGMLLVDDFDLVCYTNKMAAAYPRPYYLQVALQAWLEKAVGLGKRLVFAATTREHLLPHFEARSLIVDVGVLTPADYRFFLEHRLGAARASALDAERIFAAAPRLSLYQLSAACALAGAQTIDDERFLEILGTQVITSNVELAEVARISFADLKGFEDIIDALETHITIPLQAASRFQNLGLAPKRGVLLFGPPGTGKTSVGRALAHQLKGKFFMIDGTFTSEPPAEFYARVKRIFQLAKHNTPSIIFIDDADVLMQSERIYGLNRYLLSMLDGLESETTSMVTVMVTAMDPNQLPAALLRSGRIELWLETRLPGPETRLEILRTLLEAVGPAFAEYDASHLADETDGFTAADIKRLIGDMKALYARDLVRDQPRRPTQTYLELAATGIRRNKTLIAAAQEGRLRADVQRAAAR